MSNREPSIQRSRVIYLLISFAIFSILFSLSKGSTSISLYQLLFSENSGFNRIFFELRLTRTLSAFVSGGLLALAGSMMQLLLQNPLADPYVLGVSGGAAFFTLLMMLLGVSETYLVGGAWAGSLLTIVLILLLNKKHGWETHRLLLVGIALACGFSAGISCILFLSPNTNLHSMLFWLSGDFNNASFPWGGVGVLSIGLVASILLAPGLNILMRGELAARTLGLPHQTFKLALYLLSSLFTAEAVTLAGCVGFVGLIIPHLTRLMVGYDNRFVLPLSVCLGGGLLTLADTFARSIIAPQQIPVGIVMAMIGVPIFIWLLQK